MNRLASALLILGPFVSLVRAQNPASYCTAGTSTNGCTPAITANVQPNTTSTSGTVISVSGVPGQRQGIIFYGVDNTGFTPTPWGPASSSFVCVKPPTSRIGGTLNSGGTAGQCNGTYVVSWDAFQSAHPGALGNPWLAGDEVFLQAWYRDPLAPTASNLSNGLKLTLRNAPPVPCVSTLGGLVLVPAGTFSMGSNAPSTPPYANGPDQMPVHSVTISSCFWMGAKEVTQAEYTAVMGSNPSVFPGANKPVDHVSWFNAQAYCAAITAQQSALGNVPPGYQYRLPTEAEWEYACRAGTTTEFNVGAALLCTDAQIVYSTHSSSYCNATSTLPVGSFAPNAWGLYDMHGNVREWCLDTFSAYTPSPVTDPFVTGGTDHVVRGGSWFSYSFTSRSAYRTVYIPGFSNEYVGFRVVLAPVLVP